MANRNGLVVSVKIFIRNGQYRIVQLDNCLLMSNCSFHYWGWPVVDRLVLVTKTHSHCV